MAIHRGDVHIHMQRDFIGAMNGGRDGHIHTHVDELKLGIDQRIDSHAADAWLKAAAGSRHLLADFQIGFGVVRRAQLRRLQNGRLTSAHSRLKRAIR